MLAIAGSDLRYDERSRYDHEELLLVSWTKFNGEVYYSSKDHHPIVPPKSLLNPHTNVDTGENEEKSEDREK